MRWVGSARFGAAGLGLRVGPMNKPLQRRFALIKWERLEAWLVVKAQLLIAVNLLRAARLLHRVGMISDGGVEHAIKLSGDLTNRAHAVWGAYHLIRNRLKADADAFIGERDQRRDR